jgi:hypothetical protein
MSDYISIHPHGRLLLLCKTATVQRRCLSVFASEFSWLLGEKEKTKKFVLMREKLEKIK